MNRPEMVKFLHQRQRDRKVQCKGDVQKDFLCMHLLVLRRRFRPTMKRLNFPDITKQSWLE